MSRHFKLALLGLSIATTFPSGIHGQDASPDSPERRPRLRDLGLSIGVLPTGKSNSLTDVAGVQVGHQTIIEGMSVRTGVTAIKPHAGNAFLHKTPAAVHVANGFGKFVGVTQVAELGVIETPILLTNTLSTFSVADALVGWTLKQPGCEDVRSVNPIVGECNDGRLNDIRARRVRAEDVEAALSRASSASVPEGSVGAGTGVRCMGWKGGIGSSSRKLPKSLGGYTIGVLVQTNFGGSLTIDGMPVGRDLGRYYLKDEVTSHEHGSCIVIVATDAPLDARRLQRLARRAPLGLAAAGSPISHGSGDYVLAFSTEPKLRSPYQSDKPQETVQLLRDDQLSPLFQAVRDATEEAVINSILQATTMTGHRGRTVEAIDLQQLAAACLRHRPKLKINSDIFGELKPKAGSLMSSPRTYPNAPPSAATVRRIAELERNMHAAMAAHHVPGVSVAVVENGKLVWSRGYGVRCAGGEELVDPDTVMEACSMSKPFFAYLFLRLVERGVARLDQPLVDYLGQDYLDNQPKHRRITAEMVLTHTSGLPNWRPGGWRSGGPMSVAFEPGAKFRYSGEGFLMLQRAIENKTGKGLDELSRSNLIEPLGLAHSRYRWDERLMANASCGHDHEGKLKSQRKYYDSPNAAFSLYTSAEDYARFLVEMLRKDRSADHSLSKEMLTRMWSPVSHREDQDADWGLGWGLRKRNGVQYGFHGGSNGTGFRCYSEFQSNRGDAIVIMTNAVGGGALWQEIMEQWPDEQ